MKYTFNEHRTWRNYRNCQDMKVSVDAVPALTKTLYYIDLTRNACTFDNV